MITSKPIPYKFISSKGYCERNSYHRGCPILIITLPDHPVEVTTLFTRTVCPLKTFRGTFLDR